MKRRRARNGDPARFLDQTIAARPEGCVIWPFSRGKDGYANMRLEGAYVRVARVVCERVHGPAPTRRHNAAHSCGRGDHGCIGPSHLRWATPAENEADKVQHGTDQLRRGGARLTPSDVVAIRGEQGSSQRALAARFGVCQSTIGLILRGETWEVL